MKSIMEESRVIQTMSILLYSRFLDNLYCQIYDIQTKDLVSKCTINTQRHSQLSIQKPLSLLHIYVKDSAKERVIKNQFRFNLQDFCTNTTVQQLENYVKLKKCFNGYTLLFQMYYKNQKLGSQQSISCTPLATARTSLVERKKQEESQLREIVKVNLAFLEHRVLNRKQIYSSQNDGISLISKSDKVSDIYAKSINNVKKANLGYIVNFKQKQKQLKQNNFYRIKQQTKRYQVLQSQSQIKNKKITSKKHLAFKRKMKKNCTYVQNIKGNRKSNKKLTFFDKFEEQEENQSSSNFEGIDNASNSIVLKQLQNSSINTPNNEINTSNHRKYSNSRNHYTKTNQICQKNILKLLELNKQKKSQIMFLTNKKMKMNSKIITKVKQCNSNNLDLQKGFQKNRNNSQIFYQRIYKKTLKSMNRQNKILNFVKRICQTELIKHKPVLFTQ